MNVIIGLLTHNPIANARYHLFEETRASLLDAFPARYSVVFNNGSTDGTTDVVAAWEGGNGPNRREYGVTYVPPDGVCTPGRGRNELMRWLVAKRLFHGELSATGTDTIVVLTDDDIAWKPFAVCALLDFWAAAPEDLTIVSGLFEPNWSWNTPREVVRAGGVSVLVRDSAPAAAWTFRARHLHRIFPLSEGFGPGVIGEDVDACRRLRDNGFRVGQLDLATHLGVGLSTHGNNPRQLGRPVDRKAWGLDP